MLPSNQEAVSGKLILRITCVAWLVAKVISYKVWLAYRLFPLVPPLDVLLAVPAWVHTILYVLSLLLITAVVIFPGNKKLLVGLLIAELASCLLDQNRWQPWEYQYLFIIVLFIAAKSADTLRLIAFMLSATYIYSALNKFTPGFLASVWDPLILKGYFKLPYSFIRQPFVYHAGYVLSVIELLAGIALLVRPTRRAAAGVIISMHLFILLVFGIAGIRHNTVIWPWNIAMIMLVFFVFFRGNTAVHRNALFSRSGIAVLVCWGILPALCFFGLWDSYLSANLYSGRQPYMLICIDKPEDIPALTSYQENDNNNICKGSKMLNVTKWAYRDLNVPPYPHIRVFRKIKQAFIHQYPGAACRFVTYPHATWAGHSPQEIQQEL